MSGQSIADRLTAARHSIAGQGLAKTVCKSTTEEVMGPKRKHLDYLLQCTNEPNVSIPHLADLLIERTQNSSWVIVFKSLITIHNLMNYGNERFTQYLASNNCSFNLASFVDKTGVQGYDMSTFVRRYAKYLNEKAVSYRLMAFDFCKVKRGRDDGLLRTMNTEKLLKSLPALQKLIDALLEFDCTANELTNGVINACFMLMFKDLIRLFACYNDGTINLLEKYFDMNKKNCKDALDIYKRFLVRMDKVSEFLKVAENVGIDKGDIPDLAKGLSGKTESAPASLLDALEEHLKSMESKKGGGVAGPKPSGFNSAVSAMASNSTIQVSDDERKKILEEEGKQLQQLKETHPEASVTGDLFFAEPQEQKSKDLPGSTSPSQPQPSTNNNPFGNQPEASAGQNASPIKPSDDLLNLTGNPFIENVQSVMSMNSGVNAFGAPGTASGWGGQQFSSGGGFPAQQNSFASFPTVSNGTAGTTMSTLDSTTSTTSALPLAPSPTTVPSEEMTFDPYEPLVAMATGEGVSKEGVGGDLFSFSPTEEHQQEVLQPGGLSPAKAPDTALGRQSPAVARSVSPKPKSDAFSGNVFASDAFSSAFDQKNTTVGDAFSGNFGQDQLPTDTFPTSGAFSTSESDLSGFDAFGEILQPQGTPTKQTTAQKQDKLSAQDLDSNLALLAGNIGINGANSVKKQQHQWKPTGDQKMTGGTNWQQPNMSTGASSGWAQPQTVPVRPMMGYGQQGMQQPMMQPGMAPMGGAPMMMQGGMAPMGGMPMTSMPQMNMGGMRQPMYGGAGGYMAPGMQQPMGMAQQKPPSSQPNDPFGAL